MFEEEKLFYVVRTVSKPSFVDTDLKDIPSSSIFYGIFTDEPDAEKFVVEYNRFNKFSKKVLEKIDLSSLINDVGFQLLKLDEISTDCLEYLTSLQQKVISSVKEKKESENNNPEKGNVE